eukprot:15433023-Alexandrium_andersonii.AAC.1
MAICYTLWSSLCARSALRLFERPGSRATQRGLPCATFRRPLQRGRAIPKLTRLPLGAAGIAGWLSAPSWPRRALVQRRMER